MTQTDIRDNEKVATLPDDLKSIADKMLEEKFGLSVRGEVVQEAPKGAGGMNAAKSTTTASAYPSDPYGMVHGLRINGTDSRYQAEYLWEFIHRYPRIREWIERAWYDTNSQSFTIGVVGHRSGRREYFRVDARYIYDHDDSGYECIMWNIEKISRYLREPVSPCDGDMRYENTRNYNF